jgi:Raf kinase inhibitor-like YbhB/YbcL family protein
MTRSLAARLFLLSLLIPVVVVVATTHKPGAPGMVAGGSGESAMTFVLRTNAFVPGGEIPAKYTCSGADLSPELSWKDLPGGTQALALIMDDPDAPGGTFTHWVLYNLDSREKRLPESLPKTDRAVAGAFQGRNDFGRLGYGGPCPPPGKSHRYFFKLYALDSRLNIEAGATRKELELAMKGHMLGQADLMGTFKR